MVAALTVEGDEEDARLTFDTDRRRVVGRVRFAADPALLDDGAALAGTTGFVLDPAVALRRTVRLDPGEDAMEAHLVDDHAGILRLLTPPFEDAPRPRLHQGLPAGRARERQAVHPRRAVDGDGVPPHVGQGGWTWYTGSAGWYVRVALETVLGFRLDGGAALLLRPRLPADWPRAEVRWRAPDGRAAYTIAIENPDAVEGAVAEAWLEGIPLEASPSGQDGGVRVPIHPGVHAVRLVVRSG